ncbi:transmembrane protein, putative (macronuclear) [Tetrahymena thermophila SB210]|uniref:Transmembrane protein, putative n=1 Tax=Tetrahymena thermophila (strain SB210) TaxID=312017 RepID=W7X6C4_TETTS|nr:transmembrane protein, putative [Tetrahymena thermophila SB210]EWS71908.1 transmembrane protein, putative [Tetrahymena thermophila SB210]|eukprot:XP_012655565.1 transmembrane protein, putative [Tetrahymena thermophila SB210]
MYQVMKLHCVLLNCFLALYLVRASTHFEIFADTKRSLCPDNDKNCIHQEQLIYECSIQCISQYSSNSDQVGCFQQKCAHEATLQATFNYQRLIQYCSMKEDFKNKSNQFKNLYICQYGQISPCDNKNSTCVNMITDIKSCFKSCLDNDNTSNSYHCVQKNCTSKDKVIQGYVDQILQCSITSILQIIIKQIFFVYMFIYLFQ